MATFRNKLPVLARNLPARTQASNIAASRHDSALVDGAFGTSTQDHGVDICASMFDICRRSQHELLDPYNIACMFDVDSGRTPIWMFETFRTIVETLLTDIANDLDRHVRGGAVAVTLHCKAGYWALAVAENISGASGPRRAARRLTMVRALADHLGSVARALPNPHGSTIAVAIPIADRFAPAHGYTLH